jgi:ABC-type siderophore export system fused ATPase/permease subunit
MKPNQPVGGCWLVFTAVEEVIRLEEADTLEAVAMVVVDMEGVMLLVVDTEDTMAVDDTGTAVATTATEVVPVPMEVTVMDMTATTTTTGVLAAATCTAGTGTIAADTTMDAVVWVDMAVFMVDMLLVTVVVTPVAVTAPAAVTEVTNTLLSLQTPMECVARKPPACMTVCLLDCVVG